MTTYAIHVRGLCKSYKNKSVLNGLDLSVPSGTIFALLGPNGAGKTTLIRILSTLASHDAGSASVAGHDVIRDRKEVKRSISLTGQFAAVDEVLTGEENLMMMCRLSGLSFAEARKRTNELLKQFQLQDAAGKRAKTYSGGMRRRLDLALSLVANRSVLFLDEPTTGLDTISRRALWEMILALKQQGITILLTTQYLEEADELADRIAVIHGGHIVAEGTSEELKARVGGEVIELRDGNDELLTSIPTTGGLTDIRQTINELVGLYPPDTRIGIRKPSMDDVFLALTQESTGTASKEVSAG
ncbi:daunorubicin resistance protein DrrA family ABC transporter ATP-binding protein [Paenibacillus agaridevorans]|uniref:Daunorubicin resistance protein DrrA family ABC transporter ATP-binding protein n=1 Tax=Paenibacillus agaridevorans TaxID=171404 RepID=A0A2R5EGA0_9BACL|nr:ATP-binding cassette domain-containing protein [Paenibacillus agaridevorans]GBG05537.1 daunorubicin resistance protein DrrA family ABC transporter ATP-binding protein [Paenibacillus agaridevorans]